MRYHALATDYDGTLAHDGRVNPETLAALELLRQSGRKLIMVTGREIDDLLRVFPRIELFDRVVAENGALLYRPATREEVPLAERPAEEFIKELHKRAVAPLSVGRVIVATWHPHETTVLEVIRDLGLELQVIFNKGAVMVLPSGMNKATGLKRALSELGLSPHNVVGVGDAENDHAFFDLCECSVAVSNALPLVKKHADLSLRGSHGEGVTELIDMLVNEDLAQVEGTVARHLIPLGTREDGETVTLNPYRTSLLLAGTSGAGKSTLATSILERLVEQGYQFCIIDPEGDYESFSGAVSLGDRKRTPNIEGVLDLLARPNQNATVNLLGISLANRPIFFQSLYLRLREMRGRTGRPHWVIVDEAHHLLPADKDLTDLMLPNELHGMMLITVHPEMVSPDILSAIDTVLAVGASPDKTIKTFAEKVGQPLQMVMPEPLDPGEVLLWSRRAEMPPLWLRSFPPHTERRRHLRKYAEGDLGPDRSFYFRGPEQKLNLRAQNLMIFLQLADGVDDETWQYHLSQGDYSSWFSKAIKDDALAAEAEEIENTPALTPRESRDRLREAIERRYTIAA